MAHINASVISAPTNLMAMGHPFVVPAYRDAPGVPLGIDIFSRELVCFDPWKLHEMGIINSAFGLFLGLKSYGKSATMKILAIRLMMIAAGFNQMHVMINDYKPEGSSSEYDRLTKVLRSKVFRINSMQVNPFESRLFLTDNNDAYELGIHGVAQAMAEFAHGDRLIGRHGEALRIAIFSMLRSHEVLWSPRTLQKILRSLTTDQITDYNASLDAKLQSQLLTRIGKLKESEKASNDSDSVILQNAEYQMRDMVTAQDNLNIEEIKQAGYYVSTLFGSILNGPYGHMFGDTHSLYELNTQRVVTKDWRDVHPEGETLMRIIDNRLRVTAFETNRQDMLPHINLDDEQHRGLGNIVAAEAHAYQSEIARATHMCNLAASHRLASLRKGGEGSKLYELGQSIIRNLGFIAYGRLDDDPAVLNEVRDHANLSQRETNLLARLPKYTFGMKLGEDEDMRFIRIFATPSELQILPTDSATDTMLTRPDVYNADDLALFAEANGLAYLGEPAAA